MTEKERLELEEFRKKKKEGKDTAKDIREQYQTGIVQSQKLLRSLGIGADRDRVKAMQSKQVQTRMDNEQRARMRKLASSGLNRQNQAAGTQQVQSDMAKLKEDQAQKLALSQDAVDSKEADKRTSLIMATTGNMMSQNFDQQLRKDEKELRERGQDLEIDLQKKQFEASQGGKVICTQTMHQGLLCPVILRADEAYGRTLPREVMRGYHSWGIPVAKTMKQFPLLTYFLAPFAWAWANEAAFRHNGSGESNLLGRFLLKIGIPLCKFLGRRM